ncbi:hypothetical protein BC477_09180 [Clavibacter michiganensis subsp. michiganensis]|uniref:Uncharacterized protein n=1 Tax=Clavibacter michiganensis subsp. michiganensis TaxID=33013 RepID=A0A251XN88_CLAMM|nr:hypothetical protein BC477_09180 [Clavibacter michiganensis subsp. michiganensis]OUE04896.1 hypothetical protein CMMCAS07_08100 [Clavibacter michiganensis subsp. michiganensis]
MPAAPVTRVAELRITRDPLGAVADLARPSATSRT